MAGRSASGGAAGSRRPGRTLSEPHSTGSPPNAANPGGGGPGGGRVGALLLSPKVAAGTQNNNPYNHYALLCSVENLFGLPRLGFAGAPGLDCFGNDVYARP